MPSADLSGKVALVTGAAGGIGQAICLCLAQAGADIVVCDLDSVRTTELAERVRSEMRGRATSCRCDVTSSADLQNAVDAAVAEFGKLDILCNAAGVDSVYPVVDLPEEEWNRVLAINLTGVFLACKQAVRVMAPRRYGKIVNIASIAGLVAGPLEAHYCAAKFGVVGFTQSLAIEVASYNINVNAVCPGPIFTGMMEQLVRTRFDASMSPRRYYEEVICRDSHYFQRPTEPVDVAEAVLWLSSDRSRNVTAEALLVSQGAEMRRYPPGQYFEIESATAGGRSDGTKH